jgi:hypothetical protein
VQDGFTIDEFKNNKKAYTWRNRQDAYQMVATKINKFYVSPKISSVRKW